MEEIATGQTVARPRVGLLVTCLVDVMRPSVGLAAVDLLEAAGCEVVVPPQTCCGQVAYNGGDHADAAAVARQVVAAFAACDYLVAPSGSSAAMVRVHYPKLLSRDGASQETLAAATALAARTYELVDFLVSVRGWAALPDDLAPGSLAAEAPVAYHDSCSALRELGLGATDAASVSCGGPSGARRLLASIEGAALVELAAPEECCGFGGLFCVKYPEISERMAARKADEVSASGARMLVGPDLGCLLNLAGLLARRGTQVTVRHVAEVLAGRREAPPLAGDTAKAR